MSAPSKRIIFGSIAGLFFGMSYLILFRKYHLQDAPPVPQGLSTKDSISWNGNGIRLLIDESKHTVCSIPFKKGKLEGLARGFDQDNKVIFEQMYLAGHKEGPGAFFYDARPWIQFSYQEDHLEGEVKEFGQENLIKTLQMVRGIPQAEPALIFSDVGKLSLPPATGLTCGESAIGEETGDVSADQVDLIVKDNNVILKRSLGGGDLTISRFEGPLPTTAAILKLPFKGMEDIGQDGVLQPNPALQNKSFVAALLQKTDGSYTLQGLDPTGGMQQQDGVSRDNYRDNCGLGLLQDLPDSFLTNPITLPCTLNPSLNSL